MQPSEEEKTQYFMPKWFLELLLGRLSFGDTFWAGLFGSALILTPIGFMLVIITNIAFPEAVLGVLIGIIGFYAVFMTLLVRVVFTTGWGCKTVGGWRWAGMVYIVLQTSAVYALLWRLLTDGLDAI